MISYFLSFLWGICILFSLIGWGSVINRFFFPKYRIDWGQKAAWGIAFSIFVGGVLNVTWSISRTTILAYLGVGLLCWLLDIFGAGLLDAGSLSNRICGYGKDKIVIISIFAIFFLGLLQYSSWISTATFSIHDKFQAFNWHDDFHAYLVFPNKMLQTGSMGPDPFSIRRIASSLGGQSFLHTFILSVLSEKNLNIIDSGLGMVIIVGLLLGCFKDKGTPRRAAAFILIFFLLIPPPKVNTTAIVIPLALFISLFRTLDWGGLRGSNFMANSFIIALLAAAICSLKSSLIPACGILFVLSYFFYIVQSRTKKRAICEFFIAAILLGTFLLPWMISMYQSSGTLLYPLLGKGYYGSADGTFLSPSAGRLTIPWIRGLLFFRLGDIEIVSLMLLGFIDVRSRTSKFTERKASLSLSIGALLGAVIMLISTGFRIPRYNFPFVFAAIIILMTIALSDTGLKNEVRAVNYTFAFTAIFVAGMIICDNWPSMRWCSSQSQHLRYIRNIKVGVRNDPLMPGEENFRRSYAEMQQSIPEGETVLTRLAYPFLLDFRRNKVFIADYPGGASLPPGMPFFAGAEALAHYLKSKSIRYVAYSYADEANFPREIFGIRLNDRSPWIRLLAQWTFDFQDNLKQLGQTRKRIYDDGNMFVLDMLIRRGQG